MKTKSQPAAQSTAPPVMAKLRSVRDRWAEFAAVKTLDEAERTLASNFVRDLTSLLDHENDR
jgi:hypothetical protein